MGQGLTINFQMSLILSKSILNCYKPKNIDCAALLSEPKILSLVLSVLLENATHLVQPLDVRIFSPAKSEMGKMLQTWRDENRGKNIDKYQLIRVILPALEKALGNKSLIKEGFRATGLYVEGRGFDPSQVDFSRMHASEVFVQEETEDNPDGVTAAELPSADPDDEVQNHLLPVTPVQNTSHTASDPVSESHLPPAQDDSLLFPVSSNQALSHNSDLSPLTTVSREPITPVTSAPAVTEASDITAISSDPVTTEPDDPVTTSVPVSSDQPIPEAAEPDVMLTNTSVPFSVSGVSSDQPIPEAAETGVSDNPLSQFVIPLEDRKRR